MIERTFILFLLFIHFATVGQIKINPGEVHPFKISNNYNDIKFFDKIWKDADLILLGENMHGDGSTIKTKLKLIKYLHEQLGFDVLAIECAGFYQSVRLMNDIKQKRAKIDDIRKITIFNEYEEIKQIFAYIRQTQKTNRPLEVVGFDCRHYPFWKDKKYGSPIAALDSILEAINPSFVKTNDYLNFKKIASRNLALEYKDTTGTANRKFFISYIDSVLVHLHNSGIIDKSFWIQEMRNLKGHAKNSWTALTDTNYINNNERDAQMADNIKWLKNEKYAGKKMIVSAHNFHILKNDGALEILQKGWPPSYKQTVTGEYLKSQYRDKCYSLGFIAYEGFCLIGEKLHSLPYSPKDNLETAFHNLKIKNFFLDLRNLENEHILKKKQNMRAYLYENAAAKWPDVFDGIIFIDIMKPAKLKK